MYRAITHTTINIIMLTTPKRNIIPFSCSTCAKYCGLENQIWDRKPHLSQILCTCRTLLFAALRYLGDKKSLLGELDWEVGEWGERTFTRICRSCVAERGDFVALKMTVWALQGRWGWDGSRLGVGRHHITLCMGTPKSEGGKEGGHNLKPPRCMGGAHIIKQLETPEAQNRKKYRVVHN